MIVTTPCATPITTPVPAPTVAIVVLLLLQLPAHDVFANVVLDPTHTIGVPVIVAGTASTDIVAVATVHPFSRL